MVGAAAEQIRKGEGSTMKNANRIPETFQTDAEYRQWMERWQQEAREATIEGFKQNRKLNGPCAPRRTPLIHLPM